MTALDVAVLRLSRADLETVCHVLRYHLPYAEVWAYGSRVTGGGHEASDLDLVARNPTDPGLELPGLAVTKAAFMESPLPLRVDIMDWARLSKAFQQQIKKGYVVVQMML